MMLENTMGYYKDIFHHSKVDLSAERGEGEVWEGDQTRTSGLESTVTYVIGICTWGEAVLWQCPQPLTQLRT
jgi:hypothetical protein